MYPRVAAIVIVFLLSGAAAAWSGCPPGQSRNCLDLDAVPQISQRVVAREQVAPGPKSAPTAEPRAHYTGPTVGLSKTVRQTPMLGYIWAID